MSEPRYIDANLIPYQFDVDEESPMEGALVVTKGQVDRVPTADVAPVVHAYWKRVQANHNTFRCSNCGHIRELNHLGERIATPKLCEMCGAHMNGKPPGSEDFYNATD